MTNNAIISPFYDVEFDDGPNTVLPMGDSRAPLVLPSAQSYSSFVLIPLLTFAVRGRCLLIGGPAAAFFNAGVMTLLSCGLLYLLKSPVSGPAIGATPANAASNTCGCASRWSSISSAEIFSPARLMWSVARPCTTK